jgi:hypothetical protein
MPTFDDVRDAESKLLRGTAAAPEVRAEAAAVKAETLLPAETVGLAFSGGGIRSATFNLGVLQGLAKANLLDKIDYLSTVSGGGYIGGWLIRWIMRSGVGKVQSELGHFRPRREDGILLAEPKEVSFLRDYSNYLTPRKGIFGADTWAAIAAYIRNVLLNQTILIAFLGAILFTPWILGRGGALLQQNSDSVSLAIASYAVLVFTLCFASDLAAGCSVSSEAAPKRARQEYVIAFVALPLFVAAMLLAGALWTNTVVYPWHQWGETGAIVFFLAHVAGVAARWRYLRRGNPRRGEMTLYQIIFIPVFALVSGFVSGLLLLILQRLFSYWKLCTGGAGLWHAVSWGPPMIVLLFLLAGTLHIGLMKFLIPNQEQEWWARMGGLLSLLSIAWAALFALAVFVPLALVVFSNWIRTQLVLLAGWIGTTIWGVLAGRSAKTSGTSEDESKSGTLMLVAPYVFVAGLIVLLSLGGHWLALHLPGAASQPATGLSVATHSAPANSAADNYWQEVENLSAWKLLVGMAGLLAAAFLLACRVDINTFSMNLLYRNRVVRCYLGAARPEAERHPNPFTGFDQADDLFLTKFAPGPAYDGPYPIVCAALNVTHGERLAWQERKAESFVFTPLFCGFEYSSMHPDDANRLAGFHDTENYAYPKREQDPIHKDGGGVRLGTAISISGAAASPNMGFHTSPPLAFLMTVFNVRLGWWLANPRYRNDEFLAGPPEGGPRCSLLYLLKELLASTTDQSKYVYLSDGGHFENLAIYELVRRRCGFIIASDADADADMKFGDLGNAIRKCRSDFGVEITLDTTPLKPDDQTRFATAHGVLGTIQYPPGPNGEPAFQGHLLYIKATMTKHVPRDVLAYRDAHDTFPDDTTANQWFDESQFESYRSLGQYSFETLANIAGHHIHPPKPTVS